MSTTTLIIALILLAVVVVGFLMWRRSAPQLPEPAEPERLPPRRPGADKAATPSATPKKAAAAPATQKPAPKAEPAKAGAEPGAERKGDAAPDSGPEPAAKKAREAAHPDPDVDEEEDEELVPEPDDEAVAPPSKAPPSLPRRERDVEGLRKGLAKVREAGGLFGRLKALFGGKKEIDPELLEQMEEILISSDVGVKTTAALLDDIKARIAKQDASDPDRVWKALRDRAAELLGTGGGIRDHGKPTVVLMVGVNGTGKTTTIGKLAKAHVSQGRKVLLVAGDTFRAAAVEQLKIWGMRVGCEVFAAKSGADPSAVAFDAIKRAQEEHYDLVLVDTAGRLHTKANLMDELEKMVRTAGKALAGAPHETLLVVDATTGQNALQQAATFKEALPLTGIVLTKLDGTAKGGIVLAIRTEHDLPVRYVGVGERAEDLRDFDPDEFAEAMLGQSDEAEEAA